MAPEVLAGRSAVGPEGLGALLLMGQALGLIAVGASLSGWTSWVLLASLPILMMALQRARAAKGARPLARKGAASEPAALCLAMVLEMIAVRRHGLRAALMLISVPLLWSTSGVFRGAAAVVLVASGWLSRGQPVLQGSLWAAGGVIGLYGGARALSAFSGALGQRIESAEGWGGEGDVGRDIDLSRRDEGQALMETALTLPIVLLALIGAAQFGMLFSEHIFLQTVNGNVAQAAARLGGNPESGELETVMDNSAIGWLDPSMMDVTVDALEPDGTMTCDGTSEAHCTCDYGDLVRVTSEYDTNVHILSFRVDVTLRAQSCLFCWRGGYTP
ncbi:MAG: TadE/TadG family type IV pilus assembly protein [Anaerolineae bacterium]